MEELKNYGHQHPLLMLNEEQLLGNGNGVVDCSRCGEKVSAPCFSCVDCCGFYLHKTCAEAPLELNHPFHSHHPLLLLQNPPSSYTSERRACKVCQVTQRTGFVYGCSPCELAIHIDCASPLPVIEDHQHPFTLFWRQNPFICDACGTEGHHVAFTCVVDTEHGSYFCADCNVIFHVNCALEEKACYCIVSQENEDDKSLDIPVNSITKVLETNDAGEATVIEHCKHKHYLMLSDKISEHGDKCCDGCLLLISAKFYHCLRYLSNGFSYECNECGDQICLRCPDLILQDAVNISGHKHPLLFYYGNYEGQCSSCGRDLSYGASRCKDCNFHLCHLCFLRPTRVRHKCDQHILALTYDKVNDYAKYHYCDICEKERDPKHWFYHCETCDTSVHVDCVLGKYSFIKLGSTYNKGNHEHPLTFVKKIHYYPECVECNKPCEDLSLECAEQGCNYIAHWKCRNRWY
ncbi:hypothetical protein ERO13_D13G007300v2 [Gossypium hirsutum]|nr:hypothetical protein ERO13_D13G007300v2 [Gossypium hirsutum]